MRLRLRDGDHWPWMPQSPLRSFLLQCGSVSGTEITPNRRRRPHSTPNSCNAAPSQGRRSLDGRNKSALTIGEAAMRLRLRDGDHRMGMVRPSAHHMTLQCGSVSGTEITRWPSGRTEPLTGRCNAAPSQGRRSPGPGRTRLSRGLGAAMRLRLRDGDHSTRPAQALAESSRCNAAPSQGRRSPMRSPQ